MSEYMSSSSKSRDKFPIYQLYAVVVHLDAMNATFAGHYISYVRGAGGKWYMIDDSKVCTFFPLLSKLKSGGQHLSFIFLVMRSLSHT